jgi:endonuclease/exonuclease/phosphatase family metal-dependent hydrolase
MTIDHTDAQERQQGPERNIRLMTYNVLRYGDDCQGPAAKLGRYLTTIVEYARPDILALVKVGVPGRIAPVRFEEQVEKTLNAAARVQYATCPVTNRADGDDVQMLFYNAALFRFISVEAMISLRTDFDMYRLRPVKATDEAHDLYLVVIHTESGDNSKGRDKELKSLADALNSRFPKGGNVVIMGDFNLRSTAEAGYKALTQKGDAATRFADPPFALDGTLSYPADWAKNPEDYAAFLTTSTREREDQPNRCGTGGGARLWFDRILLSPVMTSGKGQYNYVKGSYQTVGNDGQRLGRSANSASPENHSVPKEVSEAIYQFSNKYPVMLELEMR